MKTLSLDSLSLDQLSNIRGGFGLRSDRGANGFSPVQGGRPGPNKHVPLRDIFDPLSNLAHPGM